ncbi:ParB/RepB/Spo0J family partition protein [Gordonia malaquae]|uniref:ParB/RepB/Spo0J family partition protein n=1 Tax=Gordonia malaquae TaxID=410332 RepID=UPI00301924F9
MTTAPEYLDIPVEDLIPHPSNIRRSVDVDTLVPSIKAQGVLEPLLVAPTITAAGFDEDGFVVLAGHRRLAAAKKAGLTTLPCCYRADLIDPTAQIAVMMAENVERDQLSAAEEATGVQAMLDLGNSVSAIAKDLGMSRTRVAQRAKISKLDDTILDKVHTHAVTIADALFIAEHPDYTEQLEEALGTNNWGQQVAAVKRAVKAKREYKASVAAARDRYGAVETEGPAISAVAQRDFGDLAPGTATDVAYARGATWVEQLEWMDEAVAQAEKDDVDHRVYVFLSYSTRPQLVIATVRPVEQETSAEPDTDAAEPVDEPAAPPAEIDEALNADVVDSDPDVEAARRARADAREGREAATDARRTFIRELSTDRLTTAADAATELLAKILEPSEDGLWLSCDLRYVDVTLEDLGWEAYDEAARGWMAASTPGEIGAAVVIATVMDTCERFLRDEPTEFALTTLARRAVAYVEWLRGIGHTFSDVEEQIAAEYAQAVRVADSDDE